MTQGAVLLHVRLTGVPEELLDEVNEWYSTVHVLDFLAAPGIVSGRRFVTRAPDGLEFLALYEHDGSCALEETFASAPAQRAKADMIGRWSSHFDRPSIEVFTEIGTGAAYDGWWPEG